MEPGTLSLSLISDLPLGPIPPKLRESEGQVIEQELVERDNPGETPQCLSITLVNLGTQLEESL